MPLAAQVTAGHRPQLVVDERRQPIESGLIPTAPLLQ
jgi:hypothetical protein